MLPNLSYRDPHVYPIDKNTKFSSSLESDYGAFIGGTSLIIRGQRKTHRESRDTEFDVTVPLYKLSIDASKGCTLKYIYRTLLKEDVKLTMSCDFSLKTSAHANSNQFFSSWQPESSLDQEDGFRATITTTDDASESRCFLLPATEQVTGENDWITKTIHIPAVPVGNALFIDKIGVSVAVNAASLVGLTPHVIASLGYLSIIPSPMLGLLKEKNETQLIDLAWIDQEVVAKTSTQEDLSEISPEEGYRFYGSLKWTDVTKDTDDWKETDFYIISYQSENCDISFLGTSFCCQYRISGLDYGLSRVPQIIVEAVNREGFISSRATICIPLK